MRFTDMRQVQAPVGAVWAALHDANVLRRVIPGCERLTPEGPGRYAATLAARVGRLADTYRGTFRIDDVDADGALTVSVSGRGRFGSLDVDLHVRLSEGASPAATVLHYDATARVGGLVARLGTVPLTVAGGHLTGTFFRGLDGAVATPALASA